MDGGNHRCSIISDNQRGQRAHLERCDSNIGYRSHTCHSLRIAVIHDSIEEEEEFTNIDIGINQNSTQFTKNQFKQHKVYSTGVRCHIVNRQQAPPQNCC